MLHTVSANTREGALCSTKFIKSLPTTPNVIKVLDDKCAKNNTKKMTLILDHLKSSIRPSRCPGFKPTTSGCAFNFGFVNAPVKLHRLQLDGTFLPLVAVVHPGTAQQARQLILALGVVFNQLRHGAELSLTLLPWNKDGHWSVRRRAHRQVTTTATLIYFNHNQGRHISKSISCKCIRWSQLYHMIIRGSIWKN